MTFYQFANAHLFVASALSITLIATGPRHARWGFCVGLWNQWAWWYVALHDHSWGIAATNALYAINYVRGIRAYWRLSHGGPPRPLA